MILSVRLAAAQAGQTGDLRFDALEGDAIKDEAQREGGIPDARATFAGLAREKLLKRAARIVLPIERKKLKRFREDTNNWPNQKLPVGDG